MLKGENLAANKYIYSRGGGGVVDVVKIEFLKTFFFSLCEGSFQFVIAAS